MKYLVNRETKEHKVATPLAESIIKGYPDFKDDWQLVEADDEGWIPWSGGECPLPDECKCQIELQDGERHLPEPSRRWAWERNIGEFTIAAYRPILSETAEKEEKQLYTEPTKVELLFDRLKSAVAASESIPGIIAEIDALLPEGYCVAKRETQPAEDMTDWRNWREGDWVVGKFGITSKVVTIESPQYDGYYAVKLSSIGEGDYWAPHAYLRFHSRPAKESV